MISGSRVLVGLVVGLAMLLVVVGLYRLMPVRPTPAPPASVVLKLAPELASPHARIHVAADGFEPGELVAVRVTDPVGTVLTLGQVPADGQGGVGLDVLPSYYATRGDNLVSIVGMRSGVTAARPVTILGRASDSLARWIDDDSAAGQPRWELIVVDNGACATCLLVHGQAP